MCLLLCDSERMILSVLRAFEVEYDTKIDPHPFTQVKIFFFLYSVVWQKHIMLPYLGLLDQALTGDKIMNSNTNFKNYFNRFFDYDRSIILKKIDKNRCQNYEHKRDFKRTRNLQLIMFFFNSSKMLFWRKSVYCQNYSIKLSLLKKRNLQHIKIVFFDFNTLTFTLFFD